MSLDTASPEHIFNVERRDIEDAVPGLSLLYIVHNSKGRRRALQARTDDILEHPAGEILMPHLESLAGEDYAPAATFAGMAVGVGKTFMGLRRTAQALAVFFINTDNIADQAEARQTACMMAWHAISLLQKHRMAQAANAVKTAQPSGLLTPPQTPVAMARQNLLGDVFAAVLLEMRGHRKAVESIAYRRSLGALQAAQGYKAELFPFPVVADAVRIVFDEMKETSQSVTPVALALEIAGEIDHTYDDNSIRHWWEFSLAAQEMAWLGTEKNKILSTAVYTSEDPYVRATAYLVAEALNMEPGAHNDATAYNPFTDQEVNERLHVKSCEEQLRKIMGSLVVDYNEHLFEDAIRACNTRLMQGYPVGWCGHALLATWESLSLSEDDAHRKIEKAPQVFEVARKEIAWEALRTVCRMAMHRRRAGEDVTPQTIIDFCHEKEGLALIAGAFASIRHDTP